MNEFIRECREEWRRLRVPDPVANEMAVDLEADLKEAEADGGSAEDLLGTDAFDPRLFARSWAAERGVVPPPALVEQLPRPTAWRPGWRLSVAAGVALFGLIALAGAALALHRSATSEVSAAAFSQAPPAPPLFSQSLRSGAVPVAFGLLLLLVGLVGLTLTIVYWSRSAGPERWLRRRDHSSSGPGYS